MVILKKFKLSGSEKIGTSSVLSLSDENGSDWYESQKRFGEDTLKVVFNESGIIVSMSYDVSALWPIDNSVAEIAADKVPDNLNIDGGWVFDGKKIKARVYTADELTAQASVKRDSLMAVATTTIAPLQDAVDVEDATEEEVALLKAWKKYRVALNRLDLSSTTDIIWPEQPKR